MKSLLSIVIAVSLISGVFASTISFPDSAERDYAQAIKYQRGCEIAKDEKKSMDLFYSAAEAGHANAQFEIGMAYLEGNGVITDQDKAIMYLEDAAEQGHQEADFVLSIL